jgi:hypothetical protein
MFLQAKSFMQAGKPRSDTIVLVEERMRGG